MAIEFIHSLEVAGDLTVDGVISKSDGGSSTQWDAAYGWGNHADAGYSTSNTNYYLNGVSFDTGNGKITFTISGAANKTVDIDGRYVISSHKGGGDYFAGHHSEGRLLANAYLSNDLGNARKRGSKFTLTNTSLSDGEIDYMFDGLATMAGIPTTDFEAGPVVIEFDIPRTLSYGAYVGIGFGNSAWRCKDVKIEAYSNGAWVTCVHETDNAYEDVYTNIPGNSGVGTTKFRYTLNKPNNNVRICHLWAYNYNSHLWSQVIMPRSGGRMYGDLTLDGKLTASGSNSTNWNTAYNWGDHGEAGYLASNAKAADSEKLDGIDSTGFVKQIGDGESPDYQTPSSRRVNPNTKNPTNEHYAISTFGNGGNVTGQLATHFQTGNLYSRGYNSVWSDWRRYHHSLDFSVTDVANGVTAHGWGNHADAGYAKGTIPTDFVSAANGGTFSKAITAPSFIGKLMGGATGAPDATIWCVSGEYTDWGIFYDEGSPDKVLFKSSGSTKASIALDNGNINTSGTLTASGYNSTNWDAAYGWGNHADEDYLTALPSHNHDGRYLKLNPRLKANADTITQSGIHIWDVSEATDDPTGASDGLLTTKYWDSSDWAVQMYEDFHQREIHIRNKRSGTWQSDWAQVHTTDNFSVNEVDKGVAAYGWGDHADAGYSTTDTIFNGGDVDNPVVINNTSANCVLHWSDSGDSTGAIKIKLPGFHSKSNWSMLVMRVTLYEYTSDAHTIYTVSGHDWTSGWYNKRIKKHGESAKELKYAYSSSADEDYLILGEVGDKFKYGHVTVDVIAHPKFYHSSMDISSGWEISQVTSLEGVTEQKSTNEKVIDTANPSVDNWNIAYGWGNHADEGYIKTIPINSKYLRSDVDDEATGKINFAYQVADFNDINGGLGVTPFKGAFQAKNRPGSGNYATGLEFTYHDNQARTQFAAASSGNNNTGELYVRSEKWGADKVWSDWWKILHTGNSNTSNWNTAYGWGDHADGGYLTSYSETSDLESVRARDNKIAGVINFTPDTGDILQVDGQVILKRTTANGGITIGHDDSVIIAGGDTSGTLNSNINNAEETVFIGAEGGLKVFAFPDNMSGGWGARKEWRFQNDGDTDFPGKLYPSGGSTHYVDSTRISNWQTAYGWGDHSTRGYLTRSKPAKPTIDSKIVGDTIEIIITASSTGNIDQYLVFSSVVGSDFGLISVIPPADFSEEMSVIDNSFDEGGKIEYRVYAVKQGVYSDVATTSQDFSVGELEPSNLSVVDLNNAKYIQWDAPSSKKRFVGVYNVYHHEHDTQASLSRSSASLIYSGTNTSYMKPTSNNKFHQFWVEITES